MLDNEEFSVPEIRWWLSYGGTTCFSMLCFAAIWRGSIKTSVSQHFKLMKYWERIFASLYVLCVLMVQIGTFTIREMWDMPYGPDDAWEIIWGAFGCAGTLLCVMALYSKQCYRLHLHHALLVHFAYCALCIANMKIRDVDSWYTAPMYILCIYSLWMIAVAPRVFQITGHTAIMSNNEDEWFVISFGIPRKFQEVSFDDLSNAQTRTLGYIAQFIFYCKDKIRTWREK